MVAQLVEDLLHLERREDGLDQDGRADRARGRPSGVLRVAEDVVPEARLEVALQLRQVVVRAAAALDAARGRCGRGAARSRTGSPTSARRRPARGARAGASRAGAPGASRGSSFRRYSLPSGLVNSSVRRCAACSVAWPCDDVGPGRRERVLEVGHEDARAGVERVDRHLGLGRPGDLAAAVVQVGRRRAPPASRLRGRRPSRPGSRAAHRPGSARRARGGAAGARRAAGRRCAARSATSARASSDSTHACSADGPLSTSTPATPATARLPGRTRPGGPRRAGGYRRPARQACRITAKP